MIAEEKRNVVTLIAVALLILGSTGCLATRKYVQTQAVAPLQGNIQTVDKKVDRTKTAELDQRISDVDHHAEQGYSKATAKAEAADKDAQKANQDAQSAQQTADKGVNLGDAGAAADREHRQLPAGENRECAVRLQPFRADPR